MADSDSDSSDEFMIVPIPEYESQKIVAGQAVSDIASTVKELVDNALDAGSRAIKIRLFNQGVDVIEVSDDGCGIPKHSRPLVAMKHATSKLRNFSSLYEDTYVDGKIEKKQLGFRGEALFSMANVSQNLIIMTQTKDDAIGQRFECRRDGYLKQNSVQDIQRKIGTTVAVVKLFDALPVRRADLIKRIKVQRANMLKLMQAYAVLCVGVRFNVIDITGPVGSPGKQEIKLQTSERSKCVKETVSAVFGSKFLAGMCPIVVDLSSAVSKAMHAVNMAKNSANIDDAWKIEGLVSKAPNALNNDKIARDVQFFSVNGRPVECPQLKKTISSVWRNFESSDGQRKRPACILCIYLPSAMFDINLVPDKREILITEEATICELLGDKLKSIWAQHTGKFLENEVESQSNIREQNSTSELKKINFEPRRGKMRRRNACYISLDNIGKAAPDVDQVTVNQGNVINSSSIDISRNLGKSNTLDDKLDSGEGNQIESSTVSSILPLSNDGKSKHHIKMNYSQEDKNNSVDLKVWENAKIKFNAPGLKTANDDLVRLSSLAAKDKLFSPFDPSSVPDAVPLHASTQEKDAKMDSKSSFGNDIVSNDRSESQQNSLTSLELANKYLSIRSNKRLSITSQTGNVNSIVSDSLAGSDYSISEVNRNELACSSKSQNEGTHCSISAHKRTRDESMSSMIKINEDTILTHEKQKKLKSSQSNVSIQHGITGEMHKEENSSEICWDDFNGTNDIVKLAQASRIQLRNTRNHLKKLTSSKSTPQDRDSDEQLESSIEIDLATNNKTVSLSKEEFLEMTIIGQFNLGFILALCKKNHLWILDQHACDEKYNFEKYVTETKIHEQKLIAPLPLELSPSEEQCVVENMRIFEQNGFRFHFDVSKPVRHRLSLTALPHSGSGGDGRKAVQFGKEDVGALCAILGADGASSASGFNACSGTGADGGGSSGNNAVRRYAGHGTVIRLPKAVAMFASRACRSSIMIGDSLSKQEMQQIVHKLHNLEHPWDCPHGRPTIRHVKNLIETLFSDEDFVAKRVTGPSLAVMNQD